MRPAATYFWVNFRAVRKHSPYRRAARVPILRSAIRSLRREASAFFHGQAGSSAVEYAIFVGLVLGAIVVFIALT